MNLNQKFLLSLLVLLCVSFLSCSDSFDSNKFTIDNRSGGELKINFRAEEITIQNGRKAILDNITKGRYEYETVFQVPGNLKYKTEGPVSGEVTFNVGTNALLIFYHNINDSLYTIFATLTTNDNLNGSGIGNPLGP